MKKKRLSLVGMLTLSLLLGLIGAVPSASAATYFTGDFESGTMSGWITRQVQYKSGTCTPSPCAGPSHWGNVVPSATYPNAPVRAGNKSMRFELYKNDPVNIVGSKRTELVYEPLDPIGSERWYAFSIFIPTTGDDGGSCSDTGENYCPDTSREILAQWHHEGGGSPPLALVTEGNTWKVDVRNDSTATNGYQQSVGTIEKGVWTDWIFHVKWRDTNTNALLEVYKRIPTQSSNYSLEMTYTQANNYSGETAQFKMGIYKWVWAASPSPSVVNHRVVYHDEVRFSNTTGATITSIQSEIAPPSSVVSSNATLPYAETFEDNTATDWAPIEGGWSVITDGAVKAYNAPSTSAMARSIVGNNTWTNYNAEARVKINAWAASGDRSVGLLARYSNPSNYYILNYNATAGEYRITKQVNGTFTRLATKTGVSLATGSYHTMKAEVSGSTINLYVNGTLQLTATDSSLTSGAAGLIQTNGDVRYDTFNAKQLLLTEQFEDSTANGWTVIDGNWTFVTDGTVTYRTPSTDAMSRAVGGTGTWGNYSAESKVKINAWNATGDRSVGLLARYQDNSNYYILNYNATAGELRITKQVAGVFTRLATKTGVSLSTGTWHTFKAELNGSTLKLYVNGTLELTATDSALSTGKPGLLQTYGDIRFDDFNVTTP
ncbi:heparin lyase I family protein [Paenibacillus koleovorans]|uniref:heparin lyase I family protein n=1 Tax=Paenibacillus koleovorans TaxID=121608 RepID=UPI000FD6FD36|nr:heparin lyase I family protein [Paenibacillus koleovorans]